jgi:hypothetical protein
MSDEDDLKTGGGHQTASTIAGCRCQCRSGLGDTARAIMVSGFFGVNEEQDRL